MTAAVARQRRGFRYLLALTAALLTSGLTSTLAQVQETVKVRGTITRFDGHVLDVKTRAGGSAKITVSEQTTVNSLTRLHVSDIKQGSFVGVTAVAKGPEKTLQALEVHVFPESGRGTGEGHYASDLEPGSTMTNANIDAVVDTNNGKELTLSYAGGKQQIVVPPDVPIVGFVPASRALLKPGVPVFAVAQRAPDGKLTSRRITIGDKGLKPPM